MAEPKQYRAGDAPLEARLELVSDMLANAIAQLRTVMDELQAGQPKREDD